MFTFNIESCHKLSCCWQSAATTTPLWRRISPHRGESEGGVHLQAPSLEVETTHHVLVVINHLLRELGGVHCPLSTAACSGVTKCQTVLLPPPPPPPPGSSKSLVFGPVL